MKLFRALLVCVVVVLCQAKQRLVQFPLEPNRLHVLPSVVPDRDDFEELTNTYAKVWANDAVIEALVDHGFDVTTDVEHTSMINAEKAFSQPNTNIMRQQEPDWSQFIDYDAMTVYLRDLVDACPSVYRLNSIGQTVQNREIWVVEIIGNTGPEVLMAGNIHGDETVGGQLLLRFLYDLCHRTSTDSRLDDILNKVHLFVMPMFNPDGYMRRARSNANGVDLNRDFPNKFTSDNDSPVGRQIETVHYMNFAASRNFKISLMFHGGALVANYAYDSIAAGSPSGSYSPTDRDALVKQLALDYSTNHTTMSSGGSSFPNGIVNGAQWYVIFGSLQDFMYDYRGCIDLTLEVSTTKWPSGSQLPSFYTQNYNAIVSYILNVHIV